METAGNCDGNTNYGDLFEHNGLCDFADCDDLRNFADCDYLCDFDRLRIVMICCDESKTRLDYSWAEHRCKKFVVCPRSKYNPCA